MTDVPMLRPGTRGAPALHLPLHDHGRGPARGGGARSRQDRRGLRRRPADVRRPDGQSRARGQCDGERSRPEEGPDRRDHLEELHRIPRDHLRPAARGRRGSHREFQADRPEAAAICDDAGAEVLFVDETWAPSSTSADFATVKRIIALGDDYEAWLATGAAPAILPMVDEWDAWTIPYTSGTTGKPKGVTFPTAPASSTSRAWASSTAATARTVASWRSRR